MSDNAMKKSIRGAEKLLIWLGWAALGVLVAMVFLGVFVLPYLLLFLWGDSVNAEVVAVLLLIVQFFAVVYILTKVSDWLGDKLKLLHEWAHTVNGRR